MTDSTVAVRENQHAIAVRESKERYSVIEALVQQKRDSLVSALTPGLDPDTFIAVALQAVTRQPKLLLCTPASIVKCIRDAAELGLTPGLQGLSYLVPYGTEAKLIPGYRGLIQLAMQSGRVETIEGRVVRARDVFEFEYGTRQHIRHVPYLNLTGERGEATIDDRGEVKLGELLDGGEYVAAFARVVLTSGHEQFDVMSIAEVNAIRRRSKARDEGPWVTDYAEMARKTPTRRLLKYVPTSPVVLRALAVEDEAEERSEAPARAAQSSARRALSESLHLPALEEGTVFEQQAEEEVEA